MKPRIPSRGWSVLLLLSASALASAAAPFSAEFVDHRGDKTTTGTFNYQDRSYRLDLVEDGGTMIFLVDGSSGLLRILMPAEQSYTEARPGEPMSIFMDPFSAYAYLARTKTVREDGEEPVAGIPCTKRVVFTDEQVFVNAWVSKEFGFPLKVEIPLYQRTIELRNIRRSPQDPALFILPSGYTLRAEPQESLPEWVGQIASSPVLVPPFARTLQEGQIIRLRPQSGRHISLEAAHPGPGTGAFTSVRFKGDRLLSDVKGNTINVDEESPCTTTLTTTPDETDEIIVRAMRSSVLIKAAFVTPGSTRRKFGFSASGSEPEPSPVEPDTSETGVGIGGPSTATIASRIEIRWQGPADKDDFISVALPEHPPGRHVNRTHLREGNPLKIWAPSDPGDYELRYVAARGTRVLARLPITIESVVAEVEPSGPVNVAARFEVSWQGPAAEGDFISVAQPTSAPGASINRTPVREGNPLKVVAPSDPGDYEVRYVLGRGSRLLAKAPLTVNPVTATVQPPSSVKAGTEFAVNWRGPGYAEDYLSVAKVGQPPSGSVNRTPVRPGTSLKLRAPKEPGTYEVRYILGRGNRLLATTVIKVEAP